MVSGSWGPCGGSARFARPLRVHVHGRRYMALELLEILPLQRTKPWVATGACERSYTRPPPRAPRSCHFQFSFAQTAPSTFSAVSCTSSHKSWTRHARQARLPPLAVFKPSARTLTAYLHPSVHPMLATTIPRSTCCTHAVWSSMTTVVGISTWHLHVNCGCDPDRDCGCVYKSMYCCC